jgi:hypothetical protein
LLIRKCVAHPVLFSRLAPRNAFGSHASLIALAAR